MTRRGPYGRVECEGVTGALCETSLGSKFAIKGPEHLGNLYQQLLHDLLRPIQQLSQSCSALTSLRRRRPPARRRRARVRSSAAPRAARARSATSRPLAPAAASSAAPATTALQSRSATAKVARTVRRARLAAEAAAACSTTITTQSSTMLAPRSPRFVHLLCCAMYEFSHVFFRLRAPSALRMRR